MKTFLSLFFLWLFSPTSAQAEEIVALGSIQMSAFHEVLEGFTPVCQCTVEIIAGHTKKDQRLLEKITKNKPTALLAVGVEGMLSAYEFEDVPIVYALIFDTKSVAAKRPDSTGVMMQFSPKAQLAALVAALPNMKRVGFVYNPVYLTSQTERMREAARSLGITLVEDQSENPRKVPALINAMKDKIDVFWLTPDKTVITFETLEFLAQFSMEHKIPVLAFTDRYMDMGIALGLDADNVDVGKQTGDIANRIINGLRAGDIPPEEARKAILLANRHTASKMGLQFTNGNVIYWGEKNK